MKNKSEIFISYRRDGGEFAAKKLRDILVKAHYHAFLDIEGLGSGNFNEHLLEAIDSSSDYILVLSKNCLDRCVNEDDWVRREIEYAYSKNKHIIALVNKEFVFPENLPESCKFLTSTEVEKIEYDSLDDIPILLGTIRKSLTAPCHKFEILTNRILPIVAAIFFVAVVSVIVRTAVIKTKQKFPKTKADELLIGQVLEYIDSSLSLADKMTIDYVDVLDSCIDAAANYGKTDLSITVEKFETLWGFLDTLDVEGSYSLTSNLDKSLSDSNFSKDDVKFLVSEISASRDIYMQNINHIAQLFYFENQPENEIIVSNKDYFESLKQQAYENNENYLYSVNGILNPVSKKYKPLIDFKNDTLLKYKTIDFKDYTWLDNKEIEKYYKDITALLEGSYHELQGSLNNAQDDFDKTLNDEIIANLMEAGLTKEEAIAWIENYNKIEEKKKLLTTKKLQIATDKYKLKQLMHYNDGDANELLYKKTSAAFMNGFYDVAKANLQVFEKIAPDYIDNISVINKNFSVFTENYKKYNFNGILVVGDYGDFTEYQKLFELGDIIISVDNRTFVDFDEFTALRSAGTAILQVLHNNNGILEQKNISCKGSLGLQLFGLTGKE